MTDESNSQEHEPKRWGNVPGETPPAADATPQFPAPPPARPVPPTQVSPTPPVQPTPPAQVTPPPVQPTQPAAPITPPAQVTPPVTPPAQVTPPPATPVTPPVIQPPVLGQNIGATPPPIIGSSAPVAATPAAAPVLAGEYGITEPPVAPEAPGSSSKLPWIAAVAGALVLLLGGGFFALSALGASGGGETPEAAVDAMIEALNNEDFITLGEIIEPSERRTIVEPTITQVLPELERIGVFSDELDAGDVDGVDFEFTDVTYRVEPLAEHPDIVHVYFTGGEAVSEFTADDFPFSDRFREEFSEDIEDDRQQESISESETPMVLVERDGRWYVSGWFTIAETARLETDTRLPLASEAPPALGSETPEAAVEAMVTEMVDLDLAGMIGRMDPDEMAALYRYSPLFLDEGQDALDEAKQFLDDENIRYDITNLELEAATSGDDATVSVRGFTVKVTTPDFSMDLTYGRDEVTGQLDGGELGQGSFEITTTSITYEGVVDGESVSGDIMFDADAGRLSGSVDAAGETGSGELTIDPDGVCSEYSVTANGETESGCVEDEVDEDQEQLIEFYDTLRNDWPTEFPGFDVKARRTDGQWYVSPIGTTFAAYMSVFEYIEDDAFDEWLDTASLVDPMSGVEEAFDELGISDEVATEFETIDAELDAEFADEFFEDEFESSLESLEGTVEDLTMMSVDVGASANLSGDISRGSYDVVTFDLEAGDTLVATVQTDPSSGLDTTLTLVVDGIMVAYNDDADFSANLSSSFDSQFETTVTESGTYELQVGSYDNGSAGEYELEIARR